MRQEARPAQEHQGSNSQAPVSRCLQDPSGSGSHSVAVLHRIVAIGATRNRWMEGGKCAEHKQNIVDKCGIWSDCESCEAVDSMRDDLHPYDFLDDPYGIADLLRGDAT